MSADIGVPLSRAKAAVPLVKASSQNNISATWTIGKNAIGLLGAGTFTPLMSNNRGSFQRFDIPSDGRRLGAHQLGEGVHHHHEERRQASWPSAPAKARRQSRPCGQNSRAQAWIKATARRAGIETKTADSLLGPTVAAEMQKALNGQAGPTPGVGGGE